MPTNQCFQSMGVAQEDKSGHIHIIISGQAGFITIISRTRTSHLGYCFSHFNNEVALEFINMTFLTLNDADLTHPNLSSSIVDFRGLGSQQVLLLLVSHLLRNYREGSFLINDKNLLSKMTYKGSKIQKLSFVNKSIYIYNIFKNKNEIYFKYIL